MSWSFLNSLGGSEKREGDCSFEDMPCFRAWHEVCGYAVKYSVKGHI